MKRATITLYIDPDAFEEECGEPLTRDMLYTLGTQVNRDAQTIGGYEGWITDWVEVY